jgi:hypothetical protein
VYVLGKAATLNADVGDVMLSSVVHDEHSGSTYWLDNAFAVDDLAGDLRFGSGLDSDTPYTQARTLGARGLSYYGMDSTYASSLAILRRVLRLEGALE